MITKELQAVIADVDRLRIALGNPASLHINAKQMRAIEKDKARIEKGEHSRAIEYIDGVPHRKGVRLEAA